jgi:HlyD family secretion protein
MVWLRRGVLLLIVALIVAGIVYALLPKPVAVDLGTVDRGAIEVTVDEEGVARIRDVYKVSSPVAGHLDRFPLEVGDPVKAHQTVVAEIRPTVPSFIDARSRQELEAAVGAASASVHLAEAEVKRAEAEQKLAESDLARAERLSRSGTISTAALDTARSKAEMMQAQHDQAGATLTLRINELASAQARLIQPSTDESASTAGCCIKVLAPVDGVVLKVHAESAQVVAAGALIAEIGNPDDMEVVVDLLSADAVKVQPGAVTRIEDWGGNEILTAKVRRIDPSAFTKVSALGIEEQRVNVVLDLTDPRTAWERLGHEFRVFAKIRVWQGEDVLRVPLSALFRRGEQWSVFKVVDGTAKLTPVTIDHRNDTYAEVTEGLAEGDAVVLHPSDQVADGKTVEPRKSGG